MKRQKIHDGNLEIIYKNNAPYGIRDNSGFLLFFAELVRYSEQNKRYEEEIEQQNRLANHLLNALKQYNNYTEMIWHELTPDNLPEQGTWILITDGLDFDKVFVTNQFEFVKNKDDMQCYDQEYITHWCKIDIPRLKD